MKIFFVRKTFKYDPTFGGLYSRYRGYALTSLQKRSPSIKKASNLVDIPSRLTNPIFCSPLKRGRETAFFVRSNKGLDIKILKELNEIKFSLKRLLTEEEYNKYGSDLVRERFIEAFVNDCLSEKRIDIKRRITRLLYKLKNLPDGYYLLVSHSFLMKILQSYVKNKNLFKDPRILLKSFDYAKKTFNHGYGFEFNI